MIKIFGVVMLWGLMNSLSMRAGEPVFLFNGENLDAWYAFDAKSGKHLEASDLFRVEDGMVRLYGPKAGYLMTHQSFKNYTLTAKFRWNTDTTFVKRSTKMNSGLMYLIPDSAADGLWPQGVQFQIKQGFTGDFIFLKNVTAKVRGQQNTPGKSVVVKRSVDAERPAGEWNTLKITTKNGFIRQELNGVLVNEGYECSVTAGRILLQYEGFPIDFRDIVLTPNM